MQSISSVVARFQTYIINPAILIVFAAGFFLFVYGLVEFLWKLNEGGDNKEGKQHMIWGIVGMLIMVSVYGILALLDNTFGLGIFQGGGGVNINNINVTGSFH
jgi:hypothetical protein